MDRSALAEQYFKQGYNCSQAVALAFSDLVNLSEEELLKVSIPFGGGFGRLRYVCGALSGAGIIIGLLFSNDFDKAKIYNMIQEVSAIFEKKLGSVLCRDLLSNSNLKVEIKGAPEERTKEYYEKRPCSEIVRIAAQILDDYIKDKI